MPMLRWNDETEISTNAPNRQSDARIAALAGGGFVAVWEDRLTPASSPVMFVRVYLSNGEPAAAAAIIVGGNSSFPRAAPAVVGLPNGGFQVVYTDGNVAAGTTNISFRNFSAAGFVQAFGPVTQPVPGRTDAAPAIASLGDGRIAVVYTSSAFSGPLLRIMGATSLPGPEIVLGASATATAPVVAATPGGPFLAVAWGDSATRQVQVQLVDPAGTLVGPVLVAASYAAGIALADATIAWLSAGVLAVAWSRTLQDNAAIASDVMMRLYTVAPSGAVAPLGAAFQVNSRSLGSQLDVHLTPTPEEGVVASWQDGGAIRLQAFDGLGNRIGGEYRVNVEAAGTGASIAALTDGRIAVSWQLAEDDPDSADLRLQIIDPRQGLITGGDAADTIFGNDLLGDEIRGLDGDDTIRGLAGNDMLLGGAGNDQLFGDDGNDTLQGGAGNDFLSGGLGTNRLVGGRGDDTYRPSSTDVIVEKSGEGSDTIEGFAFDINLASYPSVENVRLLGNLPVNATGSSGPNILDGTGNTLGNALSGGAGNDLYILGKGDTAVEVAGNGTDTIRTDAFNIDLGAFTSVENAELVGTLPRSATGTTGPNVLNGAGNTAANTLTGLNGNDVYILGAGDSVVEDPADPGIDTVVSDTVSLSLESFPGVENVQLTGGLPLSATGSAGANELNGETNSAANVLSGRAGADIYIVGKGDTIIELSGNDTVRSSTIALDLAAYPGVENLGLLGALPLSGTGTIGTNTLDGAGNSAANVLTGLAGNDTYLVGFGDTVVEAVGGGTDTAQSGAVDISLLAFAHVENAILTGVLSLSATGSAANNVLNGANNAAANVLTGLGGDDTYLIGIGDTAVEAPGAGTDTVQSSAIAIDLAFFPNVENITLTGTLALTATGSGADNVISGALNTAANTLSGLGGNDTYIVGTGDVVVEALGGGSDSVLSAVSYTLAPGAAVEFLRNNTIGTGLTLTGNALVQTITGAIGNDTLASGGGGDILIGGGGTDSLVGGAGADTFRFLLASDSAVGAGRDSIIGFAAGDRIDLAALDPNDVLAGNQAFSFRGSAAFSGARGELRFQPLGADVIVQGTFTGAAVAFEIRVAGVASLSASDFNL
jgi:Ca2+-binding RTX toxin-like protein